MKTVSAYDARVNFGELLNRVYYGGEEIVVERKGKPMVKIVSVEVDENPNKNPFLSLVGTLTNDEAGEIMAVYKEGRRDRSRYKKFLAK